MNPLERIRILEERLRVLSDTLRAFSEATSDVQRLFAVVAEKLANVVKDGCVVRIVEEDGWLAPVAIHLPFEARGRDERQVAKVREHVASRRHISEHAAGARVIETGEALLVPQLDLEQLRSSATPEVAEAYQTIGIHSFLLVAMRVRGKTIGLLALVRFVTKEPFEAHDLELAQALADHAALTIDNARSLQAAREQLAERERAEAALRKTEEQLRQAQKMEAVGRLAGGVAHAFNNLLSVILGYSMAAMEELSAQDPVRDDIAEIVRAGERGSDLTRQLLAFSRQQVLSPQIIDLNTSVLRCDKLLRRLIDESIAVVLRCSRRLSKVQADPSQIDQVIMNLVLNACDSMPRGGTLTIETQDVELDESYASEHLGSSPGPYVMLAISDTGTGMDAETRARIFEPFFTTKGLAKGTGLGLSTVFGIVQQSQGSIWVYSEPGRGTTFKVYLPRVDGEVVEMGDAPKTTVLTGNETVLLVEDQDEVRRVALRLLTRYGYHVLEARNAGEALLICERFTGTIHLLLSDVVMPVVSGKELADRLLAIRPELRIIFMSGYTDNAIIQNGMLDSRVQYLQKPFTPETLAGRVREALDAPPPNRR